VDVMYSTERNTALTDYEAPALRENEVDADPFVQFDGWFHAALEAKLPESNAMTLATATPDGRPSARMVLLKGYDTRGFVFYTNYESRKGHELAANPRAALILFWPQLHRQIRIEGRVERVTEVESDAYFGSRARSSQIAARASRQSQVLAGRAELDRRVEQLAAAYPEGDVPRPRYWGGFRVRPEVFEFWQGRPSRLHDRLVYRLSGDEWRIDRLSP